MQGEEVLWAAYASEVGGNCFFDVTGLERTGEPTESRADKVVGGILLGVLFVILMVLSGPGDSGKTRPPMAVVTGRVRDGVAVQFGRLIRQHAGDGLLCVLTTHRILLLAHREDSIEQLATFPRAQLTEIKVADKQRREKWRKRRSSCVRLSFVDGSGMDLHLGTNDRAVFEHVVALSLGQPAVTAIEPCVQPTAEAARASGAVTDGLWHRPVDVAAPLLRADEKLALAVDPGRGHVAARIGGEVRLRHRPMRDVPLPPFTTYGLQKPAKVTAYGLHIDGEWVDDPALAYWVEANRPDDDAVRLADVLAHATMAARVFATNQRVGVAVRLGPQRFLRRPKLQVASELDTERLAGIDHELIGHGLPPQRIARLRFTDGSQLQIRIAPQPPVPRLVRMYRRLVR